MYIFSFFPISPHTAPLVLFAAGLFSRSCPVVSLVSSRWQCVNAYPPLKCGRVCLAGSRCCHHHESLHLQCPPCAARQRETLPSAQTKVEPTRLGGEMAAKLRYFPTAKLPPASDQPPLQTYREQNGVTTHNTTNSLSRARALARTHTSSAICLCSGPCLWHWEQLETMREEGKESVSVLQCR